VLRQARPPWRRGAVLPGRWRPAAAAAKRRSARRQPCCAGGGGGAALGRAAVAEAGLLALSRGSSSGATREPELVRAGDEGFACCHDALLVMISGIAALPWSGRGAQHCTLCTFVAGCWAGLDARVCMFPQAQLAGTWLLGCRRHCCVRCQSHSKSSLVQCVTPDVFWLLCCWLQAGVKVAGGRGGVPPVRGPPRHRAGAGGRRWPPC